MMGVLVHVMSDALNNVAVIIAALVIWLTGSPARFYADPGVSMVISILIFFSSIPLVKNSGKILMQSAPRGVDLEDVKHDLEKVRSECIYLIYPHKSENQDLTEYMENKK
jgi:zinc transporter 1